MANHRQVHDGWTVTQVGGEIANVPASVPGSVHTDLLAAGLIPDPYQDFNENELAWIGRAAWRYETTFEWSEPAERRTDLVCAGLDTVATIELNGVTVGMTANMHRSYRFDVRELLNEGTNTLAVRFDSVFDYAEGLRATLGEWPNSYPAPFNFVRKMACNFGWDWGPSLVTAGIWQPIGLHSWSVARMSEVRPAVTVDGRTGHVEVHVKLRRATPEPVIVAAEIAGERVSAEVPANARDTTLRLAVPEVRRWWPRGYGNQPRYDLVVTLLDETGAELDRWQRRVGFRSVRVDNTPDTDGTPFTLLVNNRPISMRGFNWIPDDCFPHRVTRDDYAARLRDAVACGANALRVWGGGRYESEEFYDLADELGLLVSQDFLFACAAYPEEEPIVDEVAAEAHEQVVRLASHPSLVLWIGNNENLWGYTDWGWESTLDGRAWGAGYYLEMLPRIVTTLDPTRPYWPGSPWSGHEAWHPNDPAHGTMHIWDVWNQLDYTHYADYRPRFVAEFGFQGPATYATLRRAITTGELAQDSPAMRHRQKAEDGNGKLLRGLAGHLPEPATFDDWHWATQLNQARAVRFGVEHLRSLHPLCMGALVWQLNDCWPVTSWAAVDSGGRRKPLWYALRRAFADRLLTVQPGQSGGLDLVAVNDTDDHWTGTLTTTRVTFAGDPQAKAVLPLTVPPRGATRMPLPPEVSTPDNTAAELITVTGEEVRAHHFFAEDVALDLPEPRYDMHIADGAVTVTAAVLLRDLALFPDRLHPESTVDDMLVTLLPGETVTFHLRGTEIRDIPAGPPVLRCANDLVRRRPLS